MGGGGAESPTPRGEITVSPDKRLVAPLGHNVQFPPHSPVLGPKMEGGYGANPVKHRPSGRAASRRFRRAARRGLSGAMITEYPVEPRLYDQSEYEPFWAAAEVLGLPLSLHTATRRQGRIRGAGDKTLRDASSPATKAFYPALSMCDLIFSAVFERHPRFTPAIVEFELAWAPHLLSTMDYTNRKRRGEAICPQWGTRGPCGLRRPTYPRYVHRGRALPPLAQFGTQTAALISPNSRAILRQEVPASSVTYTSPNRLNATMRLASAGCAAKPHIVALGWEERYARKLVTA
jgi:Amidohydrolase